MRNLIFSALCALGIFAAAPIADVSFKTIGVDVITEAVAFCPGKSPSKKQQKCGYNTDPGKTFYGEGTPTDMIRVKVCHTYWDQLLSPRWWGPTTRYGNWSADLPASHRQCKTFNVKRGAVIDTFASCVQRIVSTPRMTRAGTYWLN